MVKVFQEQSLIDPCFDLYDLCTIGNELSCSQEILIREENSHLLIHHSISMISAPLKTDSSVLRVDRDSKQLIFLQTLGRHL
ncbi:hypothetical protein TNCV_4710831 [Trichonephila clavipes]|uniref:Uncharacterized protein n=1 Tax=Trichonephila clavipes TaxID=2585209 RepID=A0A8X6RTG3_TRICX|nr:hypothetical protein TNCV_4710831 [Trichonephila clavipes]